MARIRLPDGTEIDREIEDYGSAVGVFVYDPETRVALLVQQPRVGPIFSGDATTQARISSPEKRPRSASTPR